MNNKKYYVPNIEEFRVGFEYESLLQDTGEWVKNTVCEISDTVDEVSFEFRYLFPNKEQATSEFLKDNYRVKYLDKEDVESLGFKCIIEDQYSSNKGNYTILVDDDYFLQVILCNPEEEDIYLFQGIIKNKSELKVLLKQLNLKDE